MAAVFTEAQWNLAFEEVKSQFKLPNILPEQEKSIREFFKGKNIFVNLPTGYGKSLIYQCLPIINGAPLHAKPRGSSVIVVISPLRSPMDDQVLYLNNLCIPAIAITNDDDPEIIQQVLNGYYIVVFGSPEAFFTWRGLFMSELKEMIIGVAIDGAHCITQWGLYTGKKIPFRKWYGCLGEMRSLIPKQCRQIMILTATATKATKLQIIDTLQLSFDDVKMIAKSPDRPNISYVHMFYGKSFYEMYHAGSPSSVKEHVLDNMGKDDGHIRILISTVAFGMGVNCKLECGRAGRDGLPSTCVLLFNGLLSVHCEKDMTQYFQLEECRRKWLMHHFGVSCNPSQFHNLHECCDICASQFTCETDNCAEFWSPSLGNINVPLSLTTSDDPKSTTTRNVTKEDKEYLRKKLVEYHQDLIKQMNIDKMATCPNHILEFNNFHINEVIESCHKLFTI
ncbi:mediator of RNA polymerase II transcription subunit 34-like [Paramuricea clavata]|uniref:Mediator of RNA polymerase II transcription subunit 34-like n=1 Tax=Paramuricea clavata TaxID=317549 RepID=A0A6S7LA65_PARCT|nr:mediator of RNA polymerase II transcription subunit 34-like [Paramuricea clavata]